MTTVLFACVHNAGRSQMAAAFFNALADPAAARALSAGTQPAAHVHPEVIEAMREVQVDLSAVTPTLLTAELAAQAQLLVTMGCGEACPVVPGARRAEWDIADPKGQTPARVRAIRDQIRERVRALIAAEGWHSASRPSRNGSTTT
jgi:arsenate reductase (thioredoxin)